MQVTVTLGSGACRHVTIRDAATGEMIAIIDRDRLGDVDVAGDLPLVNRIREFVRRFRIANPSATPNQIRTAVQAENF